MKGCTVIVVHLFMPPQNTVQQIHKKSTTTQEQDYFAYPRRALGPRPRLKDHISYADRTFCCVSALFNPIGLHTCGLCLCLIDRLCLISCYCWKLCCYFWRNCTRPLQFCFQEPSPAVPVHLEAVWIWSSSHGDEDLDGSGRDDKQSEREARSIFWC